jgi:hypothetical protein
MVSKYKISDKAILTDSDGTRDMIVDGTVYYNDSDGKTLTVTNTIRTLSPDYFTDYFPVPKFQGSTSGYTSGGTDSVPESIIYNTIDKFPFSSDANATDVGDLTQASYDVTGQSSADNGYTSGGLVVGLQPPITNTIDKFPFAVDANATDVGDLTRATRESAGQSSTENGYTSGGQDTGTGSSDNVIEKFPFSTDANATDVGDLTQARRSIQAGQSSSENGYTSGGSAPGFTNVIDKFPFSTDANATDVGDLTVAKTNSSGQSSSNNGYTSGGQDPSAAIDIIEKFPFSSDANASDVGDLTQAISGSAGASSVDNGYTAGGFAPPPGYVNTIDKFPFSTDANATDVGDLTQIRESAAGQQV